MRTPKERELAEAKAGGIPNPINAHREASSQRMKEYWRKKRAAEGKGPDNAPLDRDAMAKYDADGDLVDIWERRMLNPDALQTRPIRVHTPGMHLRWINLLATGRYQRARYDEGWVPVLKAELVDEREIYGVSYTTEGYVCRGEKQGEMLMKIPEAVWKKIRMRRYELVHKSNRQIKENMQAAGSKHFTDKYNRDVGEQTASTLDHFKGEVKFGVEKVDGAEFLEDQEQEG